MLVGGEGTRLRPLTLTTPKPLLPVANQVFLDRQLSWLAAHGVDEVALSLGYLPDAFQARFPDGRFVDDSGRVVHLVYAVEPVPLGTAGAVRFAAGHLDVDERIVVCNGDVLTGLDLGALVAFHDDRDAEATIHLAQVGDPSAFGVVPTFGDGEVKAFVEKPPPGCAPTDWINAGTYVLEPSIFERIPAGLCVSIERETFPRLLEQRGRLFAMASDAYWIDIGTVDQYLLVHADLLAGRLGSAPAPGAREAAPGIWTQGTPPSDGLRRPVLLDHHATAGGVQGAFQSSVHANALPGVYFTLNQHGGTDHRHPARTADFAEYRYILAGILLQVNVYLRPHQHLTIPERSLKQSCRLGCCQSLNLHLAAQGKSQIPGRVHPVSIREFGSVVDIYAQQISWLDADFREVLRQHHWSHTLTRERGPVRRGGRTGACEGLS